MFGLAIPGRPIATSFVQTAETKWTTEVALPQQVNEFTFFIAQPLPEGFGAGVYYALPPFTSWEYLGSVFNFKPTDVFRTGWMFNDTLQEAPMVQLGVSLESVEVLQNLELTKPPTDVRREYAKKVALNLFRFIESFSQRTGQGVANKEVLMVPTNVLDNWITRFEEKYKYDPNFVMRTE